MENENEKTPMFNPFEEKLPEPEPEKRQPLEDPNLAYLLELPDLKEIVVWKKLDADEWQEVGKVSHLVMEAECFAAAGHLVAADIWADEIAYEVKSALEAR